MPKLDTSELAQQYGFALAFLNSDPSLKSLFSNAVKETWTTEKFVAKLKDTSWYKKNGEAARQAQLLKKTDPATWNARKAATIAQLSDRAAAMGAPISSNQLQQIAENSLTFNWNEAQISDVLGGYTKAVNGVYNGNVGSDVDSLKQTAWRNGVNLSATTLQSYAQQIAQGKADRGFFEQNIRKMAKTAAPGYADQLDAGMDLYDIADPYRQSMAKILERNPADIDLFDPTIRGAISATGPDGKPASKSLWQFEQDLRKDPRWLQTDNAIQAGMGVAHSVLKDMGFAN